MLLTTKTNHQEIETNYKQEKQTMEQSLHQLKLDYTTLQQKETDVSNQLSSLKRQFQQREELVSKRMQIRKDYEDMKRKVDEKKQKEEEIIQQWKELQTNHTLKQERLEEWKKQKEDVESRKQKNDVFDQNVVQPSKRQYPLLLEEKERLARHMNELHDQSMEDKDEFEKRKKANEIVLKNLTSELEEKLEIVQRTKKEMEQLETKMEEDRITTKKEIEEQMKLISNLDEATQAQRIQNEQVLREREEVKVVHDKWYKQLEMQRFEMDVLKQGAEVITSTKTEEDELKRKTKHELEAIRKEAGVNVAGQDGLEFE